MKELIGKNQGEHPYYRGTVGFPELTTKTNIATFNMTRRGLFVTPNNGFKKKYIKEDFYLAQYFYLYEVKMNGNYTRSFFGITAHKNFEDSVRIVDFSITHGKREKDFIKNLQATGIYIHNTPEAKFLFMNYVLFGGHLCLCEDTVNSKYRDLANNILDIRREASS